MDNNPRSQGAYADTLSTRNRQSFLVRLFLLALLSVLTLTSLQSKAPAQTADQALQRDKAVLISPEPPDCTACQQAFVECLAGGGGGNCYVQYSNCLANCH
jgi:hypothetical protein